MWLYVYRFFAFFVAFFSMPVMALYRIWYLKQPVPWANWLGFFSLSNPHNYPVIWMHAASIGEVRSIAPLIDRCLENPVFIMLTVQNIYAHSMMSRYYSENVNIDVGFFPFDVLGVSARAWESISPVLSITVDSELWPEHLCQAYKRKVPVWVVNQRHSDKTYRRFMRYPLVFDFLYSKVGRVFSSSPRDLYQIRSLGFSEEKSQYFGNIKCSLPIAKRLSQQEKEVRKKQLGMAIEKGRSILLAASCWPGEEELMLEVLQSVQQQGGACQLVLVPRHPVRVARIIEMVEKKGLEVYLHSQNSECPSTSVYIVDVMGVLPHFYQVSDCVYIGKSSQENLGGQSPIDAAANGVPMIFGPNMQNFADIATSLVEEGGAWQGGSNKEIFEKLSYLLMDRDRGADLGRQAQSWLSENGGCLSKIYQEMRVLFPTWKSLEDG